MRMGIGEWRIPHDIDRITVVMASWWNRGSECLMCTGVTWQLLSCWRLKDDVVVPWDATQLAGRDRVVIWIGALRALDMFSCMLSRDDLRALLCYCLFKDWSVF